jgi:hypothetical protein
MICDRVYIGQHQTGLTHDQYLQARQVFRQSYIVSEGQEKYLRELSITPVGYFTGAIKNHSRAVSRSSDETQNFQKILKFVSITGMTGGGAYYLLMF